MQVVTEAAVATGDVVTRAQSSRSHEESPQVGLDALPLGIAGGRPHLRALTSLRFVGAVTIVVGHIVANLGVILNTWQFAQAVTFFFVLSGFVLAYRYPTLSLRQVPGFYLSRFARIWPVYLVALAIVLAEDQWLATDATRWWELNQSRFWANITLTYNWVLYRGGDVQFNQGLHGPSWTLSTLLPLYLLFPLLIHKWDRTWHWKLATTFGVVIAVIVLCNTTSMREYYYTMGSYRIIRWIYGHAVTRLFEFTLGMSAALMWQRWSMPSGWLARAMRGTARATCMEVGTILLVAISVFGSIFPMIWAIRTSWAGAPVATWVGMGGITSVFFALLLIVFARGGGYVTRAMSHPLPVALGALSFCLYMIHPPILTYYYFRSRAFPPLPFWLKALFLAALLLVASRVLYTFVERPARAAILAVGRRIGLLIAHVTLPQLQAQTAARCAPITETAPSRRWILWRTGEATVCAGMLGLWVYMGHYQLNVTPMKDGELRYFLNRARFETLNVRFGDEFTLLGAVTEDTPNGGMDLRLAWRAERDTNLRYNTLVHMIRKPEDDPLRDADKRQDASESQVKKGTVWRDRIVLGPRALEDANIVAIGLYHGSERLQADRGPRDWDNCRLLLRIR